MGEVLLGIAAIITATGTAVTGLIAVLRSPRAVGRRAAEIAIDRALGEDDDDDAELHEAAEALLRRLLENREGGGS